MPDQDEDIEFGDIEPDDVFTEGDADTDWSQVDRLQDQVDAVNAVEDDDERVQAAQRWAQELAGDDIG